MLSLPFEIPDVHAGFSEAKGVLRMEDEFLVFQVQTVTLGMFKEDPETIKIEIGALIDVRHERGLFRDKLYIRPKKLQLLDAMPGKHLLELRLKIRRKHRASALILVDSLRRRLNR
ncbi:MAG: hypothetical protein E2O85_02505 [Bacteroidetes bacterium]|nr:MAG: hypothetical protein E2O85_02505 [Bacteroidota bacterium]